MRPKPPVLVADLFPEERERLLDLLHSLTPGDFAAPSPCPVWTVKDLVAHLVGDDLGGLSGGRDGQRGGGFSGEWPELVAAINEQNEAWVAATRRLSPRVLIDMLTDSRERWIAYIRAQDPMAIGPNVAWAGRGPMPMWLHVAREYTERWVHQMQIRAAVGAPGLYDPRLFHPVLDAFAHALPVALAECVAPPGTHLLVRITGEAGGEWSVVREAMGWSLCVDVDTRPAAIVELDQDTAWRLWTKGLDADDARSHSSVTGDARLGEAVLRAVAMIV